MSAISFPTSPTIGQQVTVNSNVYTWDGTAWESSTNSIALSMDNLTDADTSTTPPTTGDLLKYDGTNWVPSNTLPSIDKLSDVDTTTSAPTTDQILKWNGTNWVPGTTSSGSSDLISLSDVTIDTPTNGQVLSYNTNLSTWVNSDIASKSGYRNKLVNGSMKITQRASSSNNNISYSNITNTNKYYLADRWYYKQNRTDTYISCGANLYGDYFRDFNGVVTGHCRMIGNGNTFIIADMIYGLFQDIEARDTEEFNLGIAGHAKPMVLSFWVNVNAAGTYPVSVNIGTTHSFVSSYTIDSNIAGSIDNWRYVEIPIPPFDLASIPINGTNYPMKICFGGSIGSIYKTATSNQWVTGEYYAPTASDSLNPGRTLMVGAAQLEVGTAATPFEILDPVLQLRRCQRYFWTVNTASAGAPGWVGELGIITLSTTNALLRVTHPEIMRVAPTVTTAGTLLAKDGNGWSSNVTYNAGGSDHRTNVSELMFNLTTAGTLFRPIFIMTTSNSGRINFSADD